MSLVIELERDGRKAGHVCDRTYRNGPGCPLIVRRTSEDVLTANVFGILRRIRPSLWLRPLLNHAFRTKRFLSSSLAGLDFSFWQPIPPPASRAHIEGSTEVDVMISARDMVVFVEAKYRARLSIRTKHDDSRDQTIRLLDVAFEWTTTGHIFTRRPYLLVVGAAKTEPGVVSRYRDPAAVAHALGHRRRYADYKAVAKLLSGRVGYVSWLDVANIIQEHSLRAMKTERLFLDDVVAYIRAKMSTVDLTSSARRQTQLHLATSGGEPFP